MLGLTLKLLAIDKELNVAKRVATGLGQANRHVMPPAIVKLSSGDNGFGWCVAPAGMCDGLDDPAEAGSNVSSKPNALLLFKPNTVQWLHKSRFLLELGF